LKKILAIALVLIMAVSLFACGDKKAADPTPTPPPAATPDATTPEAPPAAPPSDPGTEAPPPANPAPASENPLDAIGFYNPDFDYFAGPRYKIQYMSATTGILYETNNVIYRNWADVMNIDYGNLWASGGDNELFINNIGTFATQGVQGLLLDPDVTVYTRVAEVCDEYKLSWMPCMGPPRDMTDPTMPLLHPCTGFDHFELGVIQGERLVKYMKDEWADVPQEEICFISMDFSVAPPIHEREMGGKSVWLANGGTTDNYLVADAATGNMDMDTAYQLVNALVSTNGNFTHWLISGATDDLAAGAANAIDSLGLEDETCIVCVGGPGLYAQWDSGMTNSWRYVLATGNQLFGEPTMAALYAFMAGTATPDNIWPTWIDVNDHGLDGHTYAKYLLPVQWVDQSNYQQYLEWSDAYGLVNDYNYTVTGITRDSVPTRAEVPAYYNTPRA
jgi:ABC-type sugar transport system substrate-binding protein